jgi:hypothetical protein
MLDRQMKLLLRIGAAIIALSAVVALASPSSLAKALGLPLDLDPEIIIWNIRVSGALLLPLAGFMALAAAFFPERALRQSGALMVAFVLLVGALLVVAPGPWSWGRALFIALGLLFVALYGKALRARLRHR